MPSVKLADDCSSDKQCNTAIMHSICNNGVCDCTSPRAGNKIKTECSIC